MLKESSGHAGDEDFFFWPAKSTAYDLKISLNIKIREKRLKKLSPA